MSFWPTGPIGITTSVIIALLCIALAVRGKSGRAIALAFAISWVMAGLATWLGSPPTRVAGLTIAAFVVWYEGARVCLVIGGVYAIRIIAASLIPVIGWGWFWEINIVFLWLQILIAFGEIVPGHGYRNKVSFFRKLPYQAYKFTIASRSDHAP